MQRYPGVAIRLAWNSRVTDPGNRWQAFLRSHVNASAARATGSGRPAVDWQLHVDIRSHRSRMPASPQLGKHPSPGQPSLVVVLPPVAPVSAAASAPPVPLEPPVPPDLVSTTCSTFRRTRQPSNAAVVRMPIATSHVPLVPMRHDGARVATVSVCVAKSSDAQPRAGRVQAELPIDSAQASRYSTTDTSVAGGVRVRCGGIGRGVAAVARIH